jgi:hypothetical protein
MENMLDYYIQCKKYYTERIHEIDKELYVTNLLQLSIKRNYYVQMKQSYENKIKHMCKHEFITDWIDIDPDRSSCIQYCKICEYTKK